MKSRSIVTLDEILSHNKQTNKQFLQNILQPYHEAQYLVLTLSLLYHALESLLYSYVLHGLTVQKASI
jgi:hypothetical protein